MFGAEAKGGKELVLRGVPAISFCFFVLPIDNVSVSDSLRLRNSKLGVVKGAFSLHERAEYRDKGIGDGGTSTKTRCCDLDIDPDIDVRRTFKLQNNLVRVNQSHVHKFIHYHVHKKVSQLELELPQALSPLNLRLYTMAHADHTRDTW